MELLRDPLAILEHGEPLDLLLRLRVLQRHGRLIGEGLEQSEVLAREEAAAELVEHGEGADRLAPRLQRDQHRRAELAERDGGLERAVIHGRVLDHLGAPGAHHLARDRVLRLEAHAP